MTANSRRKLSNLIVDRGALLRTSLPFLTLACVSVFTVLLMRWKVLSALEATQLTGVENLPAMNTLHELQSTVTMIGVFGLALIALTSLAHWLLLSHRIFGPTIPIRRHVQKLAEGDYSTRLKLRGGDEFQELVSDLNHLAETLESRKSQA